MIEQLIRILENWPKIRAFLLPEKLSQHAGNNANISIIRRHTHTHAHMHIVMGMYTQDNAHKHRYSLTRISVKHDSIN